MVVDKNSSTGEVTSVRKLNGINEENKLYDFNTYKQELRINNNVEDPVCLGHINMDPQHEDDIMEACPHPPMKNERFCLNHASVLRVTL